MRMGWEVSVSRLVFTSVCLLLPSNITQQALMDSTSKRQIEFPSQEHDRNWNTARRMLTKKIQDSCLIYGKPPLALSHCACGFQAISTKSRITNNKLVSTVPSKRIWMNKYHGIVPEAQGEAWPLSPKEHWSMLFGSWLAQKQAWLLWILFFKIIQSTKTLPVSTGKSRENHFSFSNVMSYHLAEGTSHLFTPHVLITAFLDCSQEPMQT